MAVITRRGALAAAPALLAAPALGVTVAIDNRAGAAGMIATEQVMRAPPDGHSMLAGNIGHVAVAVHAQPHVRIDPREMLPIGTALRSSLILCAHPSLGVGKLAELRAWIARQPAGSINYGSSSAGSLTHVAMELFRERIGRPPREHIPCRGSGPAMTDFIAGRFAVLSDGASVVAPFLRAGQLRGVLVMGSEPSPAFPRSCPRRASA